MSENFTKWFSFVMGGITALIAFSSGVGFFGILLIVGFMFAISVLICFVVISIWDIIVRQKANKETERINYYKIYEAKKKEDEEK